jgi:DNA polymerase III subunit delta
MPTLSMTQVMRHLNQGKVDSLYILFGEETYLRQQYTAAITGRILKDAPRDFNHDVFDADSTTLDEALSLARTPPMMAPYRVVVLNSIQVLRKADLQHLSQYIESPLETTALVCCSTEHDSRKIPALLHQQGVMIACKPLEGTPLRHWVERIVSRHQARITDEAVEGLLRDHDHDLQALALELDKLCTYVGEGGEISLTAVQDASGMSRHHSIFALSDALSNRQSTEALRIIDRLLQQGEPPLVVFSMVVRHLRLIWSAKQMASRHPDPSRLAKALGLPRHVCQQLLRHSSQFSTVHLQHLYTVAVDADLTFKTSNKAPQAILESLVLALCVAR